MTPRYGGRDVFFSCRLVGDGIYAMMDVGSLVRFSCIEDKGQPQVPASAFGGRLSTSGTDHTRPSITGYGSQEYSREL